MDKRERLIYFYEHEAQESQRLREQTVQHLEFRTASRCLMKVLSTASRVLDCCAGEGIYAFFLAERGHRVTAGDIVPHHVTRLRERQANTHLLEEVYRGDTRDLSRFPSAAFGGVLCMGALYHLHEERDRELVLDECLRVLEPGGIFVCTYMNRYAVALSNVINPGSTNEEIADFMLTGSEGVFYSATPEEMEQVLLRSGLKRLRHIALDGPVTLLEQQRLLNAGAMEKFAAYHAAVCEKPQLLGYGYHNMLMGWKE